MHRDDTIWTELHFCLGGGEPDQSDDCGDRATAAEADGLGGNETGRQLKKEKGSCKKKAVGK